jgi:hypothetical protein
LLVHFRPLALVSVLTVGDYALWNWSLQGGHDVPALVSGLTLPPLTIALIWLLALNVARLLAHSARRTSGGPPSARRRRGPTYAAGDADEDLTRTRTGQEASPSSKLAA